MVTSQFHEVTIPKYPFVALLEDSLPSLLLDRLPSANAPDEPTAAQIVPLPLGYTFFHELLIESPSCPFLLAEQAQYSVRILPGSLNSRHQDGVPAERVLSQIVHALHEAGPDRVLVDVADRFEEVGILLAEDGFEAVLEKVAVSTVGAVKPEGIAGEQAPHDGGDGDCTASEQQVEVVGDQGPRIAGGLGLPEDLTQALKEVLPVGIGFEYLPPFDAPAHDVVEQTWGVYSGFARHERAIPNASTASKLISQYLTNVICQE